MKPVRFIYNPSSGETTIIDNLDTIISIYQECGYMIVPHRLRFDDTDSKVIGELDQTYHHVLIAGGDGTVNYVVNLLMKHGIDVPIALIPAGTANDFAKMLDTPTDIAKACRKILGGTIRNIDLGLVNGVYFVNVFSCGLFTDVSQKTPTVLKNTFGKLAYYFSGINELPNFRRMHIKLTSDGGDYEGTSLLFFVFNGRTAGQMSFARQSEIDDGLLDVLIIKGDTPLATINTIFHFFLKRGKGAYPSGIIHMQCKKLHVESITPETTDIDGQPGPEFPIDIQCRHNAIRLICPKSKK